MAKNDWVSHTYTLGSEVVNIPRFARCGSFSPSSSLLTYSTPEVGRGEAKQNSTISSESYVGPDSQIASMALHDSGVSIGMGSAVATVRRSRSGKVRKDLRSRESDQRAPAPSDAMVRDRTRGITGLIHRNTVG